MKLSKNNAVELLVESVNCIIIHYALSNMLGLLRAHPIWILLFASQIWVTVRYWSTARVRTQSSWLASVLVVRLHRCEFGTAAFCRARNRLFGWIK